MALGLFSETTKTSGGERYLAAFHFFYFFVSFVRVNTPMCIDIRPLCLCVYILAHCRVPLGML